MLELHRPGLRPAAPFLTDKLLNEFFLIYLAKFTWV